MNKTVIVLNSPPNSGKDTIADLMVSTLGANKLEFKESLYKEAALYFDTSVNYMRHVATSRKYKDTYASKLSSHQQSLALGLTPREALIYVSEEVIKPSRGFDFFGEATALRIKKGLNVISDGGGWWEELIPVAEEADRVIICRLYRAGYDFEGDSRQYYDPRDLPEYIEEKVTIHDMHLSEGHPLVAVDYIEQFLL